MTINLGIAILIARSNPAYLTNPDLVRNPDARHYLLLGQNLVQHGQFSRSEKPPYVPDALRTPVYPLFVGVLDRLGGVRAIYLMQAVLHAASCLLLYSMVRAMFGASAAFWASLLFATDLAVAVMNFCPMSEPLFLFLLLGSMALLTPCYLASLDNRPVLLGRLFAGSLLLGLSILTRPAALYLPFVLAAVAVGIGISRRQLRAFFPVAAVVTIVTLAPVAGWVARNVISCSLCQLTYVPGINLVYYVAAGAYELRHNVTHEQARAMIAEEFGVTPSVMVHNVHVTDRTAAQVDAELRRVAPLVLTKYPAHLAAASVLAIVKASFSHATDDLAEMLGRDWVHPGTSRMLHEPAAAFRRLQENGLILTAVFAWQLLHTVGSLGLALVGAVGVFLADRWRRAGVLCLSALGYFYLTVAMFGFEAFWRCRLPVLPFLYAFSGLGLMLLRERLHARLCLPGRPP